MIKICDSYIVDTLKIIFDNCIRERTFPEKWKMSMICPINKKESKNVKPIFLLPILGNIFEKVIFDSLYDYFVNNKLLTPRQSGFIKGDSCVNQLLAITYEIHKNVYANPCIDTICVFLDMSKAFDKVWHNAPICNLKSYGIQPNLFTLMSNNRCKRQKRVVLSGMTSSWILSLFLIFVNDLLDELVCNPKLFADYVFLISLMHDQNSCTQSLRDDMG